MKRISSTKLCSLPIYAVPEIIKSDEYRLFNKNCCNDVSSTLPIGTQTMG